MPTEGRRGDGGLSVKGIVVLSCGAAIVTISMGLRQCFGLFLGPITADLGVSREVFGFATAIQNLAFGLFLPLTGMLADRYGAPRVIVACGFVYVCGLVLTTQGTGATALYLGLGALVGIGQSGTSFSTVIGSVNRAVPPNRRSVALGIATAGASIGMFTMVPGAEVLRASLGWSGAFLALAAIAALMLPLAIGLSGVAMPDGRGGVQVAASARAALAWARRHRDFWLLNFGFAVCGFQLAFVATYMPSTLTDRHLPASTGAAVLAVIGFANIVGTYACGVLGGRFPKNLVLACLYLARACAIVAFIAAPVSIPSALVFAAIMGLTWTGTVPLTGGLVGDIFGQRHIGLLFGIVYFTHQLGSFFGAWAGGFVFDRTGSYTPIWIGAAVFSLLAAIIHWPIRDAPAVRPLALEGIDA